MSQEGIKKTRTLLLLTKLHDILLQGLKNSSSSKAKKKEEASTGVKGNKGTRIFADICTISSMPTRNW